MDDDSLLALYDTYFDQIYRFFYYKLLEQSVSEDLTSETFLTFIKQSRSTVVKEPAAYLFGIARNVFMKHLKKKYQEPVLLPFEDEFFQYVNKYIETQDTQTLEERLLPYLSKLPEKQQTVIKLRLIEKQSLSEICTILSKDMNYVKTTQRRGLKSLRQLIACTPEITNMTKEKHYAAE